MIYYASQKVEHDKVTTIFDLSPSEYFDSAAQKWIDGESLVQEFICQRINIIIPLPK